MKSALSFLACFACLAGTFAADWPQWRGPQRNGVSAENLTTNWPATGPKLLWRASVGTGFSSLALSHGRLYTMGNTNSHDIIWCLDALTGKELWRHTYPAKLDPQWYEGGPSATPTADTNGVFTLSKSGDVFCLDAAKGTVLWRHDLRQDGLKPNRWGFAGSPLLYGDLVLLNAGSAGTALDRRTGRLVWSNNGTNPGGYASPVLFQSGARVSLLIFAAKHLLALEPQSGRELWRHPWETDWDTNITDPLVHPELPFALRHSAPNDAALQPAPLSPLSASGAEGQGRAALHPTLGDGALQPTRRGEEAPVPNVIQSPVQWGRAGPSIFISSFSRGCALLSVQDGKPEVLYENKVLHNHLSPGILAGDYLYAFSGEAKRDTDFRCIHLPSGQLKWSVKDPAFGSLIGAGGKLLVLSEKGELLLAEASPAAFRVLVRAKVLSGTCWTPPALANGLLYVRNARGELRCLDLRPPL